MSWIGTLLPFLSKKGLINEIAGAFNADGRWERRVQGFGVET
jgi:hypothetical protein